jgi:hypothetical protein
LATVKPSGKNEGDDAGDDRPDYQSDEPTHVRLDFVQGLHNIFVPHIADGTICFELADATIMAVKPTMRVFDLL